MRARDPVPFDILKGNAEADTNLAAIARCDAARTSRDAHEAHARAINALADSTERAIRAEHSYHRVWGASRLKTGPGSPKTPLPSATASRPPDDASSALPTLRTRPLRSVLFILVALAMCPLSTASKRRGACSGRAKTRLNEVTRAAFGASLLAEVAPRQPLHCQIAKQATIVWRERGASGTYPLWLGLKTRATRRRQASAEQTAGPGGARGRCV